MKRFRRLTLIGAILIGALCLILLMNITAPNPTRRRYSSEPVEIDAPNRDKGTQAERILAKDLGVMDNNNQRACICRQKPSQCSVCFADVPLRGNYTFRLPDIVTDRLIADAKNYRIMPASAANRRDLLDQLAVDVDAARMTGREVWVFTRVNTEIEPSFERELTEMGVKLVRYFSVHGHVDATDQAAQAGLLLSGVTIAMFGTAELMAQRSRPTAPRSRTVRVRPSKPSRPRDPITRAAKRADDTQDFMRRVRDNTERDAGYPDSDG
ncbi:MAG: hypothetical protein OHK0023_02090 [Anaerolineae bacterium]